MRRAVAIALGALAPATVPTLAIGAVPPRYGPIQLPRQANVVIESSSEEFGTSVSGAGDVNGDGRQDVVIGDRDSAYVIFGPAGNARFKISKLGGRGFRIRGSASHHAGAFVSGAGDVNGDGLADVIVGAPLGDANGRTDSGSAYIVFGRRLTDTVDVEALGDAGIRIDGAASYDLAGRSVSGLGDMNGDGLADVAVGAPGDQYCFGDSPSPYCFTRKSSASVVFGRTLPGTVDLAAPFNGFRIEGPSDPPGFGEVSAAGDVNGDRHPDLTVGPASISDPGSAYVVFGRPSSGTIDVGALGQGGFRMDGVSGGGVAGGGDLNGDAFADMVVSHHSRGAAVVFGKASVGAINSRALGPGGYPIRGRYLENVDSVSAGTDLSGDGRPDVLVASSFRSMAWVVFGKASTSPVDLDEFGRDAFFRLEAGFEDPGYSLESVAAAGDVSGDGRPDVVIGGRGAAFLFFGLNPGACSNIERGSRYANLIGGTSAGDRILGLNGHDRINGLDGDDCLLGGRGRDKLWAKGGADIVRGGPGNDSIDVLDGERDTVDCGAGRDTVIADRSDRLVRCERTRRGGSIGSPPREDVATRAATRRWEKCYDRARGRAERIRCARLLR